MDIKIYILIIIAWFIFNVVRAVRKANAANVKGKPSNPPVTSPQNTEFEKTLEEIFTSVKKQTKIPMQPQEARPAYTSQEVMVDEAQYSPEDIYKKEDRGVYVKEGITNEELRYIIANEGVIQDEESAGKNAAKPMQQGEKTIGFDLRQAVIYSEILRRPYV